MSVIPAIVVHGGTGPIEPERSPALRAGCAAAVRVGLAILARGGSALDAVQASVRALEDDPEFNAGVGGALTRDGTIELDAAIMDGARLAVGGVAAVPDLRRPIDLARAVLDDGEHVLLVGDAAWTFATDRGFAPAPPGSMITLRALAQLEAARRRQAGAPDADVAPEGGGTVGACAIDAGGHVAAATSTGGITGQRRGRVGDSPLAGCGTYADDAAGAASATGHGEAIVRVTLTRALVDRLRAGAAPDEAARQAIAELETRVDGRGGVICVDRAGRVAWHKNTASMAVAHASLAAPEPVTDL